MADFKSESSADFISEWPADMHRIPHHSALGYLSAIEYEARAMAENN